MDLVRFRFKLGWVELNLVTLFLLGPVRLDWVGFGFGERERESERASKQANLSLKIALSP